LLERYLDVLGDHDPLMQVVFMLNPNDRLDGQRPLDPLHAGRLMTANALESMVLPMVVVLTAPAATGRPQRAQPTACQGVASMEAHP